MTNTGVYEKDFTCKKPCLFGVPKTLLGSGGEAHSPPYFFVLFIKKNSLAVEPPHDRFRPPVSHLSPGRFAVEKGGTQDGGTAQPGQNHAEKMRFFAKTTGRMV
ncbi:MAG TPA: hypothetical protein H9857_01590 [Candidatus Desulfovibrio intestinigallinarum]|nr:hypothetical protein [Candidatus Desulfovibrio intestinigallinarum]